MIGGRISALKPCSPAYDSYHGWRRRKAEIVISYRHDQTLTSPSRTRRPWPCRIQRQRITGASVPGGADLGGGRHASRQRSACTGRPKSARLRARRAMRRTSTLPPSRTKQGKAASAGRGLWSDPPGTNISVYHEVGQRRIAHLDQLLLAVLGRDHVDGKARASGRARAWSGRMRRGDGSARIRTAPSSRARDC